MLEADSAECSPWVEGRFCRMATRSGAVEGQEEGGDWIEWDEEEFLGLKQPRTSRLR